MNCVDSSVAKQRLAPDYLSVADCLPTAPRILPRLLSVLADPDSDMSQVIDLVSFDPGLTSQLLRACNSAYIGLPSPASDVAEAVNRLGVRFVYQLAAAVCGSSSFQSDSHSALASRLWQDSVTSAFAADMLATDLDLDRGSLFTAALLHDIGKLVLAKSWGADYWRLIEETKNTPAQLIEKELEMFQIDHAELGGRVLAHWKFPPPISTSVWRHHAPVPGMPFERETACITLSEVMTESLQQQGDSARTTTAGGDAAMGVLGFSREDLTAYVGRVQENFQFVNAMCQVGN